MKLFLILLFSFHLFANDLVTNYRLNGIKDIEQQLDLELAKEAYWNDYLKDVNLTFGYLESYNSLLICEKDSASLTLYRKNEKNLFTLIKNYQAYTGKERGDKVREGDLKTPIGIYELTKKIDKVDSFYGPLAFVTSYPNTYDVYRGKDGSGIWIHGLPTEQERDEFTKGCIAINNENIKCLERNISLEETLLIINESKIKRDVAFSTYSYLLSQLYAWRYDWIYNNLESYLSFYADEFIRFDGMDLERFKKYKERVFAKSEAKKIIFTNLNVIPYPGQTNTYQITFFEIYTSNSFQFSGQKTLIVRLNSANKMQIITEK
jgi:murein L,D-transpeptidase YafK